MTERQTFAVGETIRQRHLDTVDAMSDEIASLRARVEAMREALEAISVSGIHRDPKWFGMNAHDIARQAIKDTPDAE